MSRLFAGKRVVRLRKSPLGRIAIPGLVVVLAAVAGENERQDAGTFRANGVEVFSFEAEGFDDRGSYLRRGDGSLDGARVQRGIGDDQADVGVAEAETAVL